MRPILFAFSLFISFFSFSNYFVKADELNTYIKAIKDRVPLFDNSTGSLVEVGYMEKGDILKVDKDPGKNWWQIKFGNSYAYVYKGNVESFKAKAIGGENTSNLKNSNDTILLMENQRIYDNSTGKLIPFVTIKGNMRYPIICKLKNWYKIDVGGRIGYIHHSKASWDHGVPVLMYHHILKKSENKNYRNVSTTISDSQFNEQMNWLKENGYETITLQRLEQYVRGKANIPAKAVVITFDDGLKTSFLYAYPKLKEHGFQAVNFVITGRIPKEPQKFNPDSLQFLSRSEMDAMSDVFTFESHTDCLHNLNGGKSDVLTKPYNVVKEDIKRSRDILGARYFAYPFGQYNSSIIQMLNELDFKLAVTTKQGKVRIGDPLFEIKRLGVYPEHTLKDFSKMVQN
ncbi:polysaccharide deacetylase [Anoxybacillus vitaminiphilus]|uniref:Polysaccharide deacetylase n=1 Tax=Paranoxybacillus vitaminiphilus TaxID=581036 RepID=A0A327YI51_9BACL|nr:polysaccharide deacetylase family protein [Anoxybacillus vitaminiphilus]RAK19886.1 polysaccharide deacetylase [Anoxybacillus vitaminiphilus]